MASTSNTSSMASQSVVFTTQTQYPLPSQKFMIPSTWKRYQLSQLVNKALSLDKPVPFDFLIGGEILRTTLAEWCSEHGLGEEETLQIEYIESVPPPQKVLDYPHEDWVSNVSCQIQGHFMTASYDGQIRVFDYSQKLASSYSAHPAPIASFAVISSTTDMEDTPTYTIASASHDMTAQLSQVRLSTSSASPSRTLASLHLHTAPLSSISTSLDGNHLLTSGWDGLIGYWDTSIPPTDEVPESSNDHLRKKAKKRRAEDEEKPRRKAPLQVLKSHTARVSKVNFTRTSGENILQNEAVSCGFDSTVRLWDLEMGVCKHTISASEKPFLDLCLAPTPSPTLVLATSTDRSMTLYDFRSSGLTSSVASFAHSATPSCVTAGDNLTSQQVMSGSYDGVARLWDLRSTKGALAAFKAFEGGKKILCADWSRGVAALGGEGGLSVWRVGEEKAHSS